MNQKRFHGWPAISCGLLLFSIGCTAGGTGPAAPTPPTTPVPPTDPVTYNEIVLDTYDSVSPGTFAPSSTYMELWSSDGKTLLASDDSGNSRTGSASPGCAYIDYTKGLVSGDYYVLVKESPAPTDAFGYAIRVLTAPSSSYTGWGVGGTYATEITTDLPLAGGTGIPTKLQTLVFSNSTNDKLNRFLVVNGVNWMKLTLP